MDETRRQHFRRAQAQVPQSITSESDVISLCNFLVERREITNLHLMEIMSKPTQISKMTQLMLTLSERDNNAYDAFRDGLFSIGASQHLTDLLPEFKEQPPLDPPQTPSQPCVQNVGSGFIPNDNIAASPSPGSSGALSNCVEKFTAPFADPNNITFTEMEQFELRLKKQLNLKLKEHLSPAERSFLDRDSSEGVHDRIEKYKRDASAKDVWS